MWNSVIAFESKTQDQSTSSALVRVKHLAVDCMHMSTTVLGGISSRYSIDDVSLLKFYTSCGQKYSAISCNMEMAAVCFAKATEFAKAAIENAKNGETTEKDCAKAMFDLLLGKAECAWDNSDFEQAEVLLGEAQGYLTHLPDEYEYLAAVEYNFGLYTYQKKDPEGALGWLKRSMETRGSEANNSKDLEKQARTARLAGVCLLALQNYEESWQMMRDAENMHHDPTGSYLLIKLAVITKQANAVELLTANVENRECSLDVCVASISLFLDAQRIADAVNAFEKLLSRFRDDSKAAVGIIGPRYFEALAAMGNVDKAIEVLDICFALLEKLGIAAANDTPASEAERSEGQEERQELLSRWSGLLLATGTTQADRREFSSAAHLLTRSLSIARQLQQTTPVVNLDGDQVAVAKDEASNTVLENEAVVCRLAASCALCSVENVLQQTPMSLTESKIGDQESTRLSEANQKMVELSIQHARRSMELMPQDFNPRLLLFRGYLVQGEYVKAAAELRNASSSIQSFDPAALAEAACAAHDAGSKEAVVAALRCILNLDPDVVSKGGASGDVPLPKGFFGAVLLSCVHIILQDRGNAMEDENGNVQKSLPSPEAEKEKLKLRLEDDDFFNVLLSGLRGIRSLGVDIAFDVEQGSSRDTIGYLVDVAWNAGREAGSVLNYRKWQDYFDICFGYSELLPSDPRTLHTQRMSKLMCACANVENPNSTTEDFRKAIGQIKVSRRISRAMQAVSKSEGGAVEGLLLVLEARCCIGSKDITAMTKVVETALETDDVAPGVLEQIASVCHNYPVGGDTRENENRIRCIDLVSALLSKATELRLAADEQDIEALSVTLREHLSIEFSRGSNTGRSFAIFQTVIGVIVELGDKYPDEERRWMVAVGWDRAQMYKRLSQRSEAKRWCEGVIKITEGSVPLATYRPRLEKLLESVGHC